MCVYAARGVPRVRPRIPRWAPGPAAGNGASPLEGGRGCGPAPGRAIRGRRLRRRRASSPFIHQALAPNFKPLISAVFTLAPNATWVNKSEL